MRQRDRVLRALKRHPNGLTQVDFLLPNVVDGGAPITRLAARVKDLREDGHEIEVTGERYGCAVYRLPQVEPVPIAKAAPPTTEELQQDAGTLFEAPARNAIYGDAA